MKRYAVKVIDGQEFLQSKIDVIYLGDRSLKDHNKVIEMINNKNPLNNLKTNQKYFLSDCTSWSDYYSHQIVYKKNSIVMKRVSFSY